MAEAAALIRAGALVGMPTETVYGLAGLGTHEGALAKIFSAKDRPTFDPLILHVHVDIGKMILPQLDGQWVDLSTFTADARKRLEATLQAYWPGPLTVVLPKTSAVPDLATSGLPSVALRMPRHIVALELIQRVGAPLAAPSANRFGRISPTRAEHVAEELGRRVPLILDGGPCTVGLESTVVAFHPDGSASLLRPGGTPKESIDQVVRWIDPPGATSAGLAAPGMLASHYAPVKPLMRLPGCFRDADDATVRTWFADRKEAEVPGVLLLAGDPDETFARIKRLVGLNAFVLSLSERGDRVEAAQKLFTSMRALDTSRATRLFVESQMGTLRGLDHAIDDRLRRAAAK